MSTIDTFRNAPRLHSKPADRKGRLLLAIDWLENKLERRRGRRALLEMTDDQLKDIGVSRSQAYSEAVRRFWD